MSSTSAKNVAPEVTAHINDQPYLSIKKIMVPVKDKRKLREGEFARLTIYNMLILFQSSKTTRSAVLSTSLDLGRPTPTTPTTPRDERLLTLVFP
jgi:hypothetical protein